MPSPRRDHFIPFRKRDVIDACAARLGLPGDEAESFDVLMRLIDSVTHFEFQHRLERLKECFAPADVDADTRPRQGYTRERELELQVEFLSLMQELLAAANFVPIERADLERSLEEASLFRVRLYVNFADFEDVLFFRRGEHLRREIVRDFFGLRRREIEFSNYDRVAVYVRFKSAEHFPAEQQGDLPFAPGSSVIKLFRDVPKSDLEMLFPNTQIRMRTIDKLMIGVPAAAGGVSVLITKLGATLVLLASLLAFWLGLRAEAVTLDQAALVSLGAGLAALGGFLWRQLSKFKNRKIQFMKTLSESLYFKNLDNGAGVFHRLLDAAEEEEVKEMVVAYSFLLAAPEPLSTAALDAQVEAWFRSELGCELDFEVADALGKLRRLELAAEEPGGWRAASLPEAKRRLDTRWDGYFAS